MAFELFAKPAAKFAKQLTDYMLGDIPLIVTTIARSENIFYTVSQRAEKDPEGMGIIRIGPEFYRTNLVYIAPKTSSDSKEYRQMLKQFMDSGGTDARKPYSGFAKLTQSDFVLAIEDKKALHPRKELAACLQPRKFFETTLALTQQYFSNEHKGIGDYNIFEGRIKLLVKQTIAQEFFGSSQLPEDTHSILSQIEYFAQGPEGLFLQKGFMFFSSSRQLQHKYTQLVNAFIKKLPGTDQPHLLLEILREPDADLQQNKLRAAFAILLATSNLYNAITWAIYHIYIKRNALTPFFQKLLSELRNNEIEFDNLMTRETMPCLNAFFEEAIRYPHDVAPATVRYVANETTVGKLTIPARSTVLFALKHDVGISNASEFEPERFLQSCSPSLPSKTRFGMGHRSCPAKVVSEVIFKVMTMVVLKNIIPKNDSAPLHNCTKRLAHR